MDQQTPPNLPITSSLQASRARWMIVSLLSGVAIAAVTTFLLVNTISLDRFKTKQESMEALRKEAVYSVSLYRFEGTSGTTVHNHNYENFRLTHLKTLSDPAEIAGCVTPVKTARPHGWNHYSGGTPVLLLFVTDSGPKSFFGETVDRFPDDLWIATSAGNEGVLAHGLAEWLRDKGLLTQLRQEKSN